MRGKISPFRLGLFVLVGAAIVIGGLLWIGAAHVFEKTRTYVTFFDQSVGGLNSGSSVERLGVKIGRVSSISLVQNGKLARVEMKIDPKFEIGRDEAAAIQSAGLTGGHYLAIVNAPPDIEKTTPKIDFPTRYPVIPSAPGSFSKIENSLEGIAKKFQDLKIGDFVSTWSELGQNANKIVSNKDIDETIANLKQTSRDLKMLAGDLGRPETIRRINTGINDFSAAASSAREAGGSINRQVESIPPKTIARTAERVDKAAREAEQAAAALNSNMSRTLSRFEQSANQLARVLSDLDALVQSLREEPGRILKEPKGSEPFEK